MTKECWQKKVESPTPCFIAAGSEPCSKEGCSVTVRIDELKKQGIEVSGSFREFLLHSVCDISSLSPNNKEFRQRTRNQPKRVSITTI